MGQRKNNGEQEIEQKAPCEKGLFSFDIRKFSEIGDKEGPGDGKRPEQQTDLKGPCTQLVGIHREKRGYKARSHGGYEYGHEQGDEYFYRKGHG